MCGSEWSPVFADFKKTQKMTRKLEKSPKIALCRRCHGTGYLPAEAGREGRYLCPQCEGSGRVTVSAVIEYDLRPYNK